MRLAYWRPVKQFITIARLATTARPFAAATRGQGRFPRGRHNDRTGGCVVFFEEIEIALRYVSSKRENEFILQGVGIAHIAPQRGS